MAHDPDNPLGVQIRGNERAMHFVHPYRHVGELNQVERWKLERHPLEVADAVISRYAKEGPDAIAKVPGEQERLKWVGLYPQRQGGDAFMMRVKVPGGVLTADQAREIGVVADAFGEGPDDSAVFGNRYADITTRQTIQIHWIRIADVPTHLGALRRRRAHHGPGVRRLGPQRACRVRCRAWTPTRSSTPCPWPGRSRTSSPATASTPTCPASSR